MWFVYDSFTFDTLYFMLYNPLNYNYEDLIFVIVLSSAFVQGSLILKGIMPRWMKDI
jgi:hypothetical protein